jgi:D-amino-acid dehydrogenase
MLDRSSPFALRLRPELIPWLIRFALASTAGHARRSAEILRALATSGLELHADYARAGMDTGFQHRGSVSVYETEAEFRGARRESELHTTAAFPDRVLDETALRALGVNRGPSVVGAIHFAQDAHCDSYRFVTAVGAAAEQAGASVRTGVEVRRLIRSGDRITGVETSEATLHPREVILAAGVWTGRLARQVGIFVPVEGGKGYHIDLSSAPSDPHLPVYMQESRVIATPLDGRLRLAGTLELSGLDPSVSPSRLAAVRRAGERNLSGLAGRGAVETWAGLRPCTPDGLPVIGRPQSTENLVVATGHAMKGVALAPITGKLVAELVSHKPTSFDLVPLRLERFFDFKFF